MNCAHCGASWALPAGRPAPQSCPFCRKPLGPAWRQVHTPQEGFAWALELMGREGLRESSRVLGLFADAGPELESQLQLVRIFFASGSHLALLDALGGYGQYVLISSSAVYPETLSQPFREDPWFSQEQQDLWEMMLLTTASEAVG